MVRVGLLLVGLAAVAAVPRAAQQPPTTLRFEVASVKPVPDNTFASQHGGERFLLALPLSSLIARAYGLDLVRVVGGPSLMSRWFEISAKTGNPDAKNAELNQMLKSLLIERFGLKAHTEVREADVWVLTLAKGDGTLGPRLKPSSRTCITSEEEFRVRTPGKAAYEITDWCERPPRLYPVSNTGQPISVLISSLKMMCCAIVEDRTGLTGRYDWDVLDPPALEKNVPREAERAFLFRALEQQLGLKVEPARGKVEFLVIDSVQPPTPD